MSRKEFIDELEKNLQALSYEERQSAILYYNEIIDDAGADNEESVIAGFGNPKDVASKILMENGINNSNDEKSSASISISDEKIHKDYDKTNRWLVVLIIILTSPFWIGIVSGVFGVLIGIIGAVFGILLAFFVATVVCFVAGIGMLFVHPALGLVSIGASLILASLLIMIIWPLVKAVFNGIKYCCKGIGRSLKRIF